MDKCPSGLHNIGCTVLISNDELRAADILAVENFPESISGNCRIIVHLRKVSQENSFQVRINQFVEKFNRFTVGKMSVTGLYPLLQVPWVRPVHEHALI